MSKPIRPEDVVEAKTRYTPEIVFAVFNAEIARKFTNGVATVFQNTIIEKLIEAGCKRHEILDDGWLNIEDAYREAGWQVFYIKPGYNEAGDAFFEFRKPKV